MFPTVGQASGYRIERRPPGFEFTPGLFGKITTYLAVAPDGEITIFAFMYSFLVTGGPVEDEDHLSEQAIAVVRDALAERPLSEPERTFELTSAGWKEVDRPRWWVSVVPQRRVAPGRSARRRPLTPDDMAS